MVTLAARQAADGSPAWILDRADRALGWVLERACAAILVAETVLLFCGVVARYAFHRPLVWSDELASLLFLWLSMLGAVLAMRRWDHMAMNMVVDAAGPAVRRGLQTFAAGLVLAFLAISVQPALDYLDDETIVSMVSLDISMAWRVAAMPVGISLMGLSLLLRGWRRPTGADVVGALAAAGLCAAVLALAPVLHGLGRGNLLLFFVLGVGALVFSGVPIAFAFGIATMGYLSVATRVPLSVVIGRFDAGMSSQVLLSVPLFVLLGLLIEMTGMARRMVRVLANLLGHVRGGLSYVLVGAMYLISGISGSKAADMAAIAPVLFPEMEARGVRRGELVALLAATGAQTETIPPSLMLITIGSVTGVSIASLFTGGLVPGLVVGLVLCGVVWARARRGAAPDAVRPPGRVILHSFRVALPALVLPFVIRGAVVAGVATATEVSTIGIVYAVLAGLVVYREFDWRRVFPMLVQTSVLTGAILLIIGAATSMAWAITQSGISRDLAALLTGVPGGAVTFMAASILIFIVLGSVLEGIPAVVLMGPLLFPLAGQLGIHEVQYAMVAILAMGVGLFSPPFGVGYYVACAIGRCEPDQAMRQIGPYLVALFVGLVIVAAVPWFSIGFL